MARINDVVGLLSGLSKVTNEGANLVCKAVYSRFPFLANWCGTYCTNREKFTETAFEEDLPESFMYESIKSNGATKREYHTSARGSKRTSSQYSTQPRRRIHTNSALFHADAFVEDSHIAKPKYSKERKVPSSRIGRMAAFGGSMRLVLPRS